MEKLFKSFTGAMMAWVLVLGMLPGTVQTAEALTIGCINGSGAVVDYIEPVSDEPVRMVEHMGGYWDTRRNITTLWKLEEYYCYDINISDFPILIHFTDGTVRQAEIWDEIDDYSVQYSTTQKYNPWKPGKQYVVTVSYRGKKTTIPVVIEESPVAYIEPVSTEPVELIEYANGYWNYRWNDKTQQEERFFYYYLPCEEVQILIHYKDGTVKQVELQDIVDGDYSVQCKDTQHEEPWESGKENTVTVTYLDKETTVSVVIAEGPVDYIEPVSAEPIELMERVGGYWSNCWNDETQEEESYYRYELAPSDVQVSIHYKDGTVKQAWLYDEVDEGYSVQCEDTQSDDPWEIGKENEVTVSYMGKEVIVPVVIVAVTFPVGGDCGDHLTWSLAEDGVLTISGTGAMWDAGEIAKWRVIEDRATAVSFPEGITSIGSETFAGCVNLTGVMIPDGVTSIGDNAFCNCESLTDVTIPNSLTGIGDGAFSGCTSLTDITIPDSVTGIGAWAFSDCNALTDITIPASVEDVETGAFMWCESLTSVEFAGSAPNLGEDAFYNVTATVYYPANDPTWTEEVRQSYGGNLTWVACEPEPGDPNVASGDLDGNGETTDADAIYLLMHTFFPEDYPVSGDCDYDRDGEITDADAIYLLMYTFFPQGYPLMPPKE